jgi:signal peptidase I
MTNESASIAWLCRFYSVLLFAYPREFRLAYGGPMRQLFRDRCREVVRSGDRGLLRFSAQIVGDWVRSSARERAAALRSTPAPRRRRSFVTEWAGTILMYLFATTTLVQAYVVPTGSMEPAVLVGDHILVDRLAYADPGALGHHILPYRDIQRGDIIAFLYPEDPRQTYVKRVIGLPGDRIHLDHGQVIRNGRRLVEPYVQRIATEEDSYRDNFPLMVGTGITPRAREMLEFHVRDAEVVVPPGALFALGDNRDNSADSRYWGFVPRSNVVGKPLLVYWSFDAPTADLEEWSVGHVVDVAAHFFTKTRWDRMLRVPRSQQAEEVAP